MSCRTCGRPDAAGWREEWGCDGPTDDPVLLLDGCWRCAGADDDCEVCNGTDRAKLYECPNRVADATAFDVIRHAALFAAQMPAWPVAGGTEAQAAVFWDALFFSLGQHCELTKPPPT